MNRGSPTEQGTRRQGGARRFRLARSLPGSPITAYHIEGVDIGAGEALDVVPAVVDADRLEAAARAVAVILATPYQPSPRGAYEEKIARTALKAAGLTVEGEQSEGETQ